MEQSKIDRMNALAKKAKTAELTPEEKAERAELRAEYIEAFRNSLRAQLENVRIVEADGSMHKLPHRKKK